MDAAALAHRIWQRTHPPLPVNTFERRHAGKRLVIARVLASEVTARPLFLYRRTAGSEPVVVDRLSHPRPELLDRLDDLIWTRRQTLPVNYPDGTQVSIAGFPKVAVREALANALLHADWRYEHPVRIEQSPESLSITSPGPLVEGVHPGNVLTVGSAPRNSAPFNAATHPRLSERTGQGFDRIYRELIRACQDAPDIGSTPGSVTGRMSCHAPRVELGTLIGLLPDGLDESLHRLGRAVSYQCADPVDPDLKVRWHLADHGQINNRTLRNLFDVDIERARTMLDDLRKRQVIKKLPGPERGRGVEYGPGDAL